MDGESGLVPDCGAALEEKVGAKDSDDDTVAGSSAYRGAPEASPSTATFISTGIARPER